MKTEIGIAKLFYDYDGVFIRGEFKPTLVSLVSAKDMSFMEHIDCTTIESKMQGQATNIFASWFEKVNQIELVDLTKQKFETEFVGECLKHTNGNIASCSLKFFLIDL